MSLIPRGFWNPLGQPQRAGPLSGTRSHGTRFLSIRAHPRGVAFLLLLFSRARSVSRLNEECCFFVGEKDEHTFCAFHRFVRALRSRYCVYALLFARTNADLMFLSPLLLPRVLFLCSFELVHHAGLFGRRRFTPDPVDRFFGDDNELMASSFLDSMIPREHVSDMNQFDFVCDIVEKNDRYTLSGELPGCNVNNVDIKMDKDNNLHVAAHKRTKHEEEDQSKDGRMKWHAIERSSGRVERIFTLPEGADPEKVEASMKDGILTIDVKKKPEAIGQPKPVEEGMKTIPIKAE